MNRTGSLKDSCPLKPHTVSKKMKWTSEEDELLISRIKKFGTGNWSLIALELSGRTGKQCRERWTNQLNPNLNRDNWTLSEDRILLQQQQICGNSWSKIAMFLPGRSSNSVKNRWSWLVRHRVLPNSPTSMNSAIQQKQQNCIASSEARAKPVPLKQRSDCSQQHSFVKQVLPQQNIESKQKDMNFDPVTQDIFEPLPFLLMGSTNDVFVSEYENMDFSTCDVVDKSLSLWDSL